MSLSHTLRQREVIASFLKSNPIELKENLEEQAAKKVDQLLGLVEGDTREKAIKLKVKMQAQQKGQAGYAVLEGEFPKTSVSVLDKESDQVDDLSILNPYDSRVIDFNKCHQLDFLHYLLYFFVYSYYSLANNPKKKLKTEEKLQITAENLLNIHIYEIWIIMNAYLIRKKCSEIIREMSEDKEDKLGPADEDKMRSFISSVLDEIIAGSKDEFEYCIPAGSPTHAIYLILMYKRQSPESLTIRVDNPSYEKPILFNCGAVKEEKARNQVVQYLTEVCLNMRVGRSLDPIKIINNEIPAEKRFSFERIKDKDATYPSRPPQHGPNCVWHGYEMGQWYRLCQVGAWHDGRVYKWLFQSTEQFHIKITPSSTFEIHQGWWDNLFSVASQDQKESSRSHAYFNGDPLENNHHPREKRKLPDDVNNKELPQIFHPHMPSFAQDRFIKREKLLNQLNIAFSPKPDDAISPLRSRLLTVCNGLGGVGKTQLALYFYHKTSKPYAFRCWFLAERLEEDYREFCKHFRIPFDEKAFFEVINMKVKQWLEEHPGWLLIYDNTKDCDTIAPYLPKTGGDILLTSRCTLQWNQLGGKTVAVDILAENEAIELMKLAVFSDEEPQQLDEEEKISLKELVAKLGYLPLALAQASAYIKNCPSMTFTSYLEKYKNTPIDYLEESLISKDVYPLPVAKTWLITMEEIQKKSSGALRILQALAYLAPDGVPVQILSHLVGKMLEEKEEEFNTRNSLQPEKILSCLTSFSMASYQKETKQVSIHRLVQAVIRDQDKTLPKEELYQKRLKPLAITLKKLYPDFYNKSTAEILFARQLAPHIQVTYDELTPFVKMERKDEESALALQTHLLLVSTNILTWVLGNAKKAKEKCMRALTLTQTMYGENHPQVAIAWTSLGDIEYFMGAAREALSCYEKALAIRLCIYGEESPEVAMVYNNIGRMHDDLMETKAALQSHQKALAIYLKIYGEEHQDVATTYNNLGNVQNTLGNAKAQLEFHEKALPIKLKIYGDEHPQVASSYNYLGIAYMAIGNTEGALASHQKALGIYKKIFGEEHATTAGTYNNIGWVHQKMGDAKVAFEFHEKALTLKLKIYEKEHPAVAAGYSKLGRAYHALGNAEKALACHKQSLAIRIKVYGEEHTSVAMSYDSISLAHEALGDKEEARRNLEKALRIYKRFDKKEAVLRVLNRLEKFKVEETSLLKDQLLPISGSKLAADLHLTEPKPISLTIMQGDSPSPGSKAPIASALKRKKRKKAKKSFIASSRQSSTQIIGDLLAEGENKEYKKRKRDEPLQDPDIKGTSLSKSAGQVQAAISLASSLELQEQRSENRGILSESSAALFTPTASGVTERSSLKRSREVDLPEVRIVTKQSKRGQQKF